MVDKVLSLPERTRFLVLSPLVRGRKGEHAKVFSDLQRDGYTRVRVDGELLELGEEIRLQKTQKHTIEVVVDRLVVREGMQTRLADSLETALRLSGGLALVQVVDGEQLMFSRTWPATSATSPWRNCLRACSPSTIPTAPAPPVRALAP